MGFNSGFKGLIAAEDKELQLQLDRVYKSYLLNDAGV